MSKLYRIIPFLAALGAASANLGFASTIVFDNQSAHPGGTFTFGTSSGTASLTNGVIDQITHINGSISSFAVTGTCGSGLFGCLNFTTGAFLDSVTTPNSVIYRYAAGGSLSIVGNADGGTGTLFSAAGFAAPVTLNYNTVTGLSSLSGTLVAGTINAALAASLGINPNTIGGTDANSAFNLAFAGNIGTGTATTNGVQITASDTPEPASLFLLGSGFIGLSLFIRKCRAT